MPDLPISLASPALPPCQLHVAHRGVQEGWCVVEVEGEVDLSTAPVLEAALVGLRVGHGVEHFLLDLSGVGHLDSSGLSVLTRFRHRMGPDGELKLAGLQAGVLNVLALTGLDRIFDIWPTARSFSDHLNDSPSPHPADPAQQGITESTSSPGRSVLRPIDAPA